MPLIILGLGSNIAPREGYLAQALELLRQRIDPRLVASKVYRSMPYHGLEQEGYLNQVVLVQSKKEAGALLDELLQIEAELGRVRGEERWTNRTIDIDILSYGDLVCKEPGLEVPHYDLHNRDFFLIPIAEILPDFRHPKTGLGIQEMIRAIPSELKTKLEPLP